MSAMSIGEEGGCPKALEFEQLREELAVALATDEAPSVIRCLEQRIQESWALITATDACSASTEPSLICLGE